MNSYNENLQTTVDETLNALSSEQSKIASEQTTAQYNLYYAQGADLTARNKLDSTDAQAGNYSVINAQGVFTNNQTTNLISAATQTYTTVATATTNVSAAASNMQIASNAVALLASDVGAALNVATASLYDTDTYRKISDANKLINECANDAKAISLITLDTSAKTSEIIAKETLTNAQSLKTKIGTLLASTQAEFDSLSALQLTESKKVAYTSVAERAAEGDLLNADRSEEAITIAYDNAIRQLNHNLSVTVTNGCTFTLDFTALPQSDKLFQYVPANGVKIPCNTPNYFLALVPSSKKALLTSDLTSELFAESGASQTPAGDTNVTLSHTGFTHLGATPGSASTSTVTVNYNQPDGTNNTTSVDLYGDPILKGSEYIAILYIELTPAYKQYINNYSDLISSPSAGFTLATQLPAATTEKDKNHLSCKVNNSDNFATLKFFAPHINIPSSQNTPANVQYRVIFVKDDKQCLNLLTERTETIRDDRADSAAVEIEVKEALLVNEDGTSTVAPEMAPPTPIDTLPIYFNKEIALQVSPSNYYFTNQPSPTPTPPSTCDVQSGATQPQEGTIPYTIKIPLDGTDNFGEPLISGQKYFPKILTVVDGDISISSQYIPELAADLKSITVK